MQIAVLLNKLPNDVRLIVSRRIPNDRVDLLRLLLTVLEDELVARKHFCDGIRISGHHSPDFKTLPLIIATTLLAETQRKSNSSCYCQQVQSTSECQVVKGIDTSKQILKASGRCFNCLAKGRIGKKVPFISSMSDT